MFLIDAILKGSIVAAVLLILIAAAVDVILMMEYKEENKNIEKMFEDIKEEENND